MTVDDGGGPMILEIDAHTNDKIVDEHAHNKNSQPPGRAHDHHQPNPMQKHPAKGFK